MVVCSRWWNDRRNIYFYVAFQLAEQRCASCVFGSWWCVVGGGMMGGISTVMWHFSWPSRGVLLVCLGHGGVLSVVE